MKINVSQLLAAFNSSPADDEKTRGAMLQKLLGTANGVVIRPPFQAETGLNIHFDEACFVDTNCTIQDTAPVRIGAFVQIAPNVQILTAANQPVTIGRNVWIGAGAILHPGVTLGDDAIISGGSVVSQNVPEGATVAGNPARVIG